MVVELKLTEQGERALALLQRRFRRSALLEQLSAFFDREAPRVAGRIVRDMLSGQRLARRTGNLARSVEGRSDSHRGLPGMRIGIFRGPALPYAAIQEFGGTIRPRRARALAVPARGGPALTPAGVDRFGGPRGYPGELKFIPFRRSGVAVGMLADAEQIRQARRRSRGAPSLADIDAVYLLLRKVQLRGKHYLRDGVQNQLPAIIAELGRHLRGYLGGRARDERGRFI